jgi:CheY-like chemotaxis protein
VQQSGGHIFVYSEPGRGTTFKIHLPSAAHKMGLAQQSSAEEVLPRHDGTTILLVEDDVLMRSLARQMLVDHGYAVIEAKDGASALAHVSAKAVHIDLMLTDVVMPGITGPELALRLIDSHPETKVVYMSGYTGELLAGDRGLNVVTLLEKPFTRAALLKTIQAALESQPAAS